MNKKIKFVLIIICSIYYIYSFSNYIFASNINYESSFSITFFPVGKGDCIIVECDGETMLVDAGYLETSDEVIKYLNTKNTTNINYLIITHPHKDHIGGIPSILDNFDVATIYKTNVTYPSKYYKELEKSLAQKNYNILSPSINQQIKLGEATITFLGPLSEDYDEINNTSIVVKVEYRGQSILLTGDMQKEAEQDLINNNSNLSSSILKVGHHGNYDSTSTTFLESVNPSYAIITCDSYNGHSPDIRVLYELLVRNIKVLRTDVDGIIIFHITKQGEIISESNSNVELPIFI